MDWFVLVSKVGAMTLALARTFAPNLGKIEKKVREDGTVEIVKLSGLRGIGHAGLASLFLIYFFLFLFLCFLLNQ